MGWRQSGQEGILGWYETPEAASQARDAKLRRLGLHAIARLNEASVHQAARACGDERKTTGA